MLQCSMDLELRRCASYYADNLTALQNLEKNLTGSKDPEMLIAMMAEKTDDSGNLGS